MPWARPRRDGYGYNAGSWSAEQARQQRDARQAVADRMHSRVREAGIDTRAAGGTAIVQPPGPNARRSNTAPVPGWAPGGVVTSGAGYPRSDHTTWTSSSTFTWDPSQMHVAMERLRGLADQAGRISVNLKAWTPPASCDCGIPSDSHWEHSADGCTFIEHKVRTDHMN